jgi:hypothetical protein
VVVTNDVITQLLPLLSRSRKSGFNVFDVMRHGTHEKQLSNVFGWLLDTEGTHALGNMFQKIFIEEVNRGLLEGQPFGPGPYSVRQEVNTASTGKLDDIADLVLTSDDAVLVVENYFTSDGHGHSYAGYLRFGQLDGRRSGVVLLCRDQESSLLREGWENASVVTYGTLVDRLHDEVTRDGQYQRRHPDAYSFIQQMHRKYARGKVRMHDREVLDFVTEMCATGEARRYGERSADLAAQRFSDDVALQAMEHFADGRELLQLVKGRLRTFGEQVLRRQLNETRGDGFVSKVSATYAGIYQWTVNFDIADDGGNSHIPGPGATYDEAALQLKFGPSAWHANEADPKWVTTVDGNDANYSHVFLTSGRSSLIRQSAVTIQEVLDGIGPDDRRLHDEILDLLQPRT